MSRTLSGALLLVSVVLLRLAFPPYDLSLLMLAAWAPFLWVTRSARPREALLFGFAHGLGLGVLGHVWIVPVIVRHTDVPAWQALGALLALAGSCGLRSALVAWGLALATQARLPLSLTFPLLLAGAELLVPGFFPWSNALALHSVPVLLQLAAYGGATLVGAWLSLLNALLVQAATCLQGAKKLTQALVPLVAAGGVVTGVSLFGLHSISSEAARSKAAPRIHVALGQAVSRDEQQPDLVPELRSLTIDYQQRAGESQLVVWPEGVSPTPLRLADAASTARGYWLRDRQQSPTAPQVRGRLLLGVSVDEPSGLRNSALLIDRGGAYLGEYAKQQLVPLGETGLFPGTWSSSALGAGMTSYQPGTTMAALSLDGHPLAVSICFEDILSEPLRSQVVRSNAELLVNLTSDRWLKGTDAVDFHFALAKLRAIEHRKYLVRSTLDGFSAVVDSTGVIVLRAEPTCAQVVGAHVPFLSGLTPYARFAPLQRLIWLALAALLLSYSSFKALVQTRAAVEPIT